MNFPDSITNYLEQKITYKQFQDEIVNVTSVIAKEKFTVEDSKILLSQLSELIPKLSDSDFQNSTREFFNFALNLADKQVYNVFFSNQCSLITQQLKRANEISLFIFHKILNNEKLLLECINEKLEILKTIEKKFILLELQLLILPNLEQKNVLFQTLLPSLLKNLNLCVEKFVKSKGKYKNSEEMENQTKNMTQNFETWTMSYLTRIIEVLLNLKEIQNLPDDTTNPNHQIKFYIQLFLLDLSQGLIETMNQGQYFDTTKIQQFFNSYVHKLSSVFNSTCDILTTLLQQLKNLKYEGIKNPQMIQVYSPQYRYNIVSCGYLLVEMFKDKSEHSHLSLRYKKELLLNVIKEFFEYESGKDQIKTDLLNLFNQLFSQKIQNKERNLNIYNVNLPKVLVQIVSFKGQQITQLQQEELFNSFRNVVHEFNENAQFLIFQEMIDSTDSLLTISFLIDEFINIFKSKLNDQQPQSCYFINKNSVIKFIEKCRNKGEIHSISDRATILGQSCQIWELIFQQLQNNSNNIDNHLLNSSYKQSYVENVNNFTSNIQKQLTQFVTQSQKDKFDAEQKKEKDKNFNLELELEKIKSKENLTAPLQSAIDHLKDISKIV